MWLSKEAEQKIHPIGGSLLSRRDRIEGLNIAASENSILDLSNDTKMKKIGSVPFSGKISNNTIFVSVITDKNSQREETFLIGKIQTNEFQFSNLSALCICTLHQFVFIVCHCQMEIVLSYFLLFEYYQRRHRMKETYERKMGNELVAFPLSRPDKCIHINFFVRNVCAMYI